RGDAVVLGQRRQQPVAIEGERREHRLGLVTHARSPVPTIAFLRILPTQGGCPSAHASPVSAIAFPTHFIDKRYASDEPALRIGYAKPLPIIAGFAMALLPDRVSGRLRFNCATPRLFALARAHPQAETSRALTSSAIPALPSGIDIQGIGSIAERPLI